METIQPGKLVLFGAGKIGRSLIAQLFSTGGYEVVFIDINKSLIDVLNQQKQYKIVVKSDINVDEIRVVNNVRGVHTDNRQEVVEELATAGIVAVSVGVDQLESIFTFLAEGLIRRFEIDSRYALDIIIAENLRNADLFFHRKLKELLPIDYPLDKLVGLIETSIGKMVPVMEKKDLKDDPLRLFAESYNILILDGKAFKNPIPEIKGLAPKMNMKAWVDCKLFIHNMGHSASAYIGFIHNPNLVYIHEALAIPRVTLIVREAMRQAAQILLKMYPDEFTYEELLDYIDDLMIRFQNKALNDTIHRVGSDLMRKLGPQDRFAGIIKLALEFNHEYDKILYALVCGCHFNVKNENGSRHKGDIEVTEIYKTGIKSVLTEVCLFDEIKHSKLINEAKTIDMEFKI